MKKYLQVAERLREIRENRVRTTQDEVAKRLGISLRGYQNYEAGERIPHAHILTKMAEMGDTTIEWILTGELNIEKARIIERAKAAIYLEEIVDKLEEINRREERLLFMGIKEKAAEYGLERVEEKDLIEKLKGYIANTKVDFLPPEKRKSVEGLIEILESGDKDIIDALTGNIKAFLGATRDRKGIGRKHARVFLNIPVEFKIIDAPEVQSGTVINASQLGLCIQSSREMEVGKKISIEISFIKNTGPEVFMAKGEILWRNKPRLDDAEGFQYGVKLINVLNEDRVKLESLLKGGD